MTHSVSQAEPVLLERRGAIALVTLNRPEVRNAVNAALARMLEAVVATVEAEDGLRVAVITGAGDRAFSSGADLREVAAGGLDQTFTAAGGFAGFVHAARRKPWIAAVRGLALAGGFEMVLACDLAVASEDARFGLPEVRRGLIASAGGLYRLPRALPKAVALEMIATGNTINAARALELGLINRTTAGDSVLNEALTFAEAICACAPLAVRESVAIARAACNFDDGDLRARGDEAQTRLQASADFTEGARAFIEKRPPHWLGR